MPAQEDPSTEKRLYGETGQPRIEDIQQDRFFNCFFLAPAGAIAATQPDRVKDIIRYDPQIGSDGAGGFQVTLHKPGHGPVEIAVSQQDVDYNIRRNGGSTADNTRDGATWPAVLETAFVKLHAPNGSGDSLKDAFKLIESQNGGSLSDAMFALTGESGSVIRIGEQPPRRTDGKALSAPPEATGEASVFEVKTKGVYVPDEDAAFAKVRSALDAGHPVTLSTLNKEVNDGLMENHAYMVTDIRQHQDQVLLTLRNPYATNRQEPSERSDTSRPEIGVSLDRMVANGAFGEFHIGPAPRVQYQHQDASQSAHDPRNPEHPDHKLYAQIEAGVKRIDTEKGREFDSASEHLALAAFRDAKAAGIRSADHIALNQTGKAQPDGSLAAAGTSLFIVQGKDPSAPLAPRSQTDVKQAVEQPVEHHLQKIEQFQQQQTQAQVHAQAVDNPTQSDVTNKGPKL